jgi:hypothetical protein
MTATQSPWHPENEVERLLCSLAGVVSARVVANPFGRLDEIHILATPLLNPKQIVRNVESALAAGLGIIIDRRIVSVAQIRRDALEPLPADTDGEAAAARAATEAPAAESPATAPEQRIVFVGWNARSQPSAQTECHVTVRRNGTEYTGRGTGASSAHGRALAGARALFAALAEARGQQDLVLEDAKVVESQGKNFVLVAARVLKGRVARPLTGVAPLANSPEEAGILAALQATNRWTAQAD